MNEDMTTGTTKPEAAKGPQGPVLPEGPQEAVQRMIKITEQLNQILDREAMALATQDTIMFSALQEEKHKISQEYKMAADEFTARVQSFRGVNKALLERMDKIQEELHSKAEASQRIMRSIIDGFKQRTVVQQTE